MKTKTARFRAVDILLIIGAVLPFLVGIVIKVLTKAPANGIEISGAQIYFSIPMPLQPLVITESQINSLLVIISLLFLCLYMTHGIAERPQTRRQVMAEWIVEQVDKLINSNMGEYFREFAPFIAGVMGLSAISSLLALLGLYPPTSDINIVGGWALLVFILITYYKLKCGPIHYMKSFGDPVAFLAPLNIIGEVATPISMSFRHYGNILSGSVISVLVATGLQGLSKLFLGWLPGALGEFPFLQVGLPAILSLYFDLFSSLLQAFIFAMLTMLYVAGAFAQDDYEKLKIKKLNKRRKQQC